MTKIMVLRHIPDIAIYRCYGIELKRRVARSLVELFIVEGKDGRAEADASRRALVLVWD